MGTMLTSDDQRLVSTRMLREVARAERFDVRLRFGSAADANRYLRAVTSLLFGASSKVVVPLPPQLDLFGAEDEKTVERKEQLERLWELREHLTRDLAMLLHVAPGLVDHDEYVDQVAWTCIQLFARVATLKTYG